MKLRSLIVFFEHYNIDSLSKASASGDRKAKLIEPSEQSHS
jgi:hypothetical protein